MALEIDEDDVLPGTLPGRARLDLREVDAVARERLQDPIEGPGHVAHREEDRGLVAPRGTDGPAIASELAARLYHVPLLRTRIEDNPQNSTRFLVVGRRPIGPTGRDKTSILFAMRNVPGALYRILEPLARDGINLTKIESRPARQSPWEYVIFVDLEGHRETHQIAAVLREMGERTLFLKVLGSYPAA